MFTVSASLAICLSLMGCNRNQQAQMQAPVVAATPACNCPQQAVATAVAAPVAHRHRHHRRSGHAVSDYSESYSSEFERSYSPESSSAMEYGGDAEGGQSEVHSESAAWIDGYGRAHYAGAAAPDDSNPAVLTAEDVRRRVAPWHAYNADCDRTQ
jgi:uncharacterized lipoprotein NlpE involved in copper resistance